MSLATFFDGSVELEVAAIRNHSFGKVALAELDRFPRLNEKVRVKDYHEKLDCTC